MTRKRKTRTEIFSIFGQCEAAAAEHMIERDGLTKIEANDIPPSAAFNQFGNRALFAVVVPGNKVAAFHRLCQDLRA